MLKRYWVKTPSAFYAFNVYARDDRHARTLAREFLSLPRLPAHTDLWS
jgi:hypothetical protein